MDRRVFIGTLARGLLTAPPAPEVQQAGKTYRIGEALGDVVAPTNPWQLRVDKLFQLFKEALPTAARVAGGGVTNPRSLRIT